MQVKLNLTDAEFGFIKDGHADPQPGDVLAFDELINGAVRLKMKTDTSKPWKSLSGTLIYNDGEKLPLIEEAVLLGSLADEYILSFNEVENGGDFRYNVLIDDKNFDTHETGGVIPALAIIADFGERLSIWFEVEPYTPMNN